MSAESALQTSASFDPATNRCEDWGAGAYDNAGNLKNYAGKSLEYDAENRQTKLIDSPSTFRYYYDGDGRRVKKEINGATTVYVYDALGQLAAEYSEAANPASGMHYLAADHLGSTRLVTDDAGSVSPAW